MGLRICCWDGGFSIYVRPAKDYVLSEKVYCRFHIAQHSKDIELMKLFIKFFNCGVVHLRSNSATPRCDFIVQDATSSLLFFICPLSPPTNEMYKGGEKKGGKNIK
jgi:hypothetical protein